MLDRTVPYIHVAMARPNLDGLPSAELPEGYALRMYRPGDARHWAAIETSCGEFDDPAKAEAFFPKEFGDDDARIAQRMAFVTAPDGTPCATVAAWFCGDAPAKGARLHWLGVSEQHQRKGISKFLVAWALRRAAELGHEDIMLTTQTASWVAIKVYQRAGFAPMPHTERDEQAWGIIGACIGCECRINGV